MALLMIILKALAYYAAIAAVALIILHWQEIASWFQSRQNLVKSDYDNIAFTLNRNLQQGSYTVVQGIFNKRQGEIIDAKQLTANQMDSTMNQFHANNDLVIYK